MRSRWQGHEALPAPSRPARCWEQLTGSDARPRCPRRGARSALHASCGSFALSHSSQRRTATDEGPVSRWPERPAGRGPMASDARPAPPRIVKTRGWQEVTGDNHADDDRPAGACRHSRRQKGCCGSRRLAGRAGGVALGGEVCPVAWGATGGRSRVGTQHAAAWRPSRSRQRPRSRSSGLPRSTATQGCREPHRAGIPRGRWCPWRPRPDHRDARRQSWPRADRDRRGDGGCARGGQHTRPPSVARRSWLGQCLLRQAFALPGHRRRGQPPRALWRIGSRGLMVQGISARWGNPGPRIRGEAA